MHLECSICKMTRGFHSTPASHLEAWSRVVKVVPGEGFAKVSHENLANRPLGPLASKLHVANMSALFSYLAVGRGLGRVIQGPEWPFFSTSGHTLPVIEGQGHAWKRPSSATN